MDMAVSVPGVGVDNSSLSVLLAEAAVPGPHLSGEAVSGNVHLFSALEGDASFLGRLCAVFWPRRPLFLVLFLFVVPISCCSGFNL